MRRRSVTIGSRGSRLALWQAEFVRAALTDLVPDVTVRIEIIKTTGDVFLDAPLSRIGAKGLFTKEIEQALIDGRIDLAVHSLKDVPTSLPHGLRLGAVTLREDVRDVLISRRGAPSLKLEDLPAGATIGTGSLRRTCQLLNWRPDLRVVDLRGNLNTRLSKLDQSDWNGIILARAGVIRLGAGDRITETLPVDRMLPAVGQGALGIEVREGDKRIEDMVRPLEDEAARISTGAERSLLRVLEGGCQVPIGAWGRIEKGTLLLEAMIGSLDGKRLVRGSNRGKPDEGERLGEELAKVLLKSGGKEILGGMRSTRLEEVSGA